MAEEDVDVDIDIDIDIDSDEPAAPQATQSSSPKQQAQGWPPSAVLPPTSNHKVMDSGSAIHQTSSLEAELSMDIAEYVHEE